MSFFDSICVLSLLLTVHYHNAGCTNSFSVQGRCPPLTGRCSLAMQFKKVFM